jgi:hypothetical protein
VADVTSIRPCDGIHGQKWRSAVTLPINRTGQDGTLGWHRVSHRLRQDHPNHHQVLYWDDGPLDSGELLLWLDEAGGIARFQLCWRQFRASCEHVAEWQRGYGLRFGEVDDGAAGWRKMTPIIRYRQPDAVALAGLRDYFVRNAAVLEPHHRAAIARALHHKASRHGRGRRRLQRRRRAPFPVSGKAGGTGDGIAATSK